MSAKDCTSFSLNDSYQNDALLIDNNQHNNLNLNQNFKCSNLIPVQSKTVFSKNDDIRDSDSFCKSGRNIDLLLNKDTTPIGFFDSAVEKDQKKCEPNSSLACNIRGYENFVEEFLPAKVPSTKKSILDQSFWITSSSIDSSFEFPRQQENDENKVPEMAQFKAGQQLLNPNEIATLGTVETQSDDIPTAVEDPSVPADDIFDTKEVKDEGFKVENKEELEQVLKEYEGVGFEEKDWEPKYGSYIAESFKVLKKIGCGAGGSIFLAERKGRLYAIKISEIIGGLKREFDVAQKCKTKENILTPFYFNETEDYEYMIMALLGPNLLDYLMAKQTAGKTDEDFKEQCFYFKKCFEALEQLHHLGILHQDVKLQNFAVSRKNDEKVLLIDMGHAENVVNGVCIHGQIGTPDFASRDAIKKLDQTYKSDLESLLYSMIYCIDGLDTLFDGNDSLAAKIEFFNSPVKRRLVLNKFPTQFDKLAELIDRISPETLVDYREIKDLMQQITDGKFTLIKNIPQVAQKNELQIPAPSHSKSQHQNHAPENSVPIAPPISPTKIDEKTLPRQSPLHDAAPKETSPNASPSHHSQSSEAQILHSTQPNHSGEEYVWFENQKHGISIKQGQYVFHKAPGDPIKYGDYDAPSFKYRFRCYNKDKICYFKIDVDVEEYKNAEDEKPVTIIGIDQNYPKHTCLE